MLEEIRKLTLTERTQEPDHALYKVSTVLALIDNGYSQHKLRMFVSRSLSFSSKGFRTHGFQL